MSNVVDYLEREREEVLGELRENEQRIKTNIETLGRYATNHTSFDRQSLERVCDLTRAINENVAEIERLREMHGSYVMIIRRTKEKSLID